MRVLRSRKTVNQIRQISSPACFSMPLATSAIDVSSMQAGVRTLFPFWLTMQLPTRHPIWRAPITAIAAELSGSFSG